MIIKTNERITLRLCLWSVSSSVSPLRMACQNLQALRYASFHSCVEISDPVGIGGMFTSCIDKSIGRFGGGLYKKWGVEEARGFDIAGMDDAKRTNILLELTTLGEIPTQWNKLRVTRGVFLNESLLSNISPVAFVKKNEGAEWSL